MDNINQMTTNIIICIGPIGSGKTTIAYKLASLDPIFEAIDGDMLDLGIKTTMILGKERNDYTRWKIIQALMMGRIPVISMGGGALFSSGHKQCFVLREQIESTLGIKCKVIVCVPGHFDNITFLDKNHSIDEIYADTVAVKNAVIRHIYYGEWTIDPKFGSGTNIPCDCTPEEIMRDNFIAFIIKKSADNAKFAKLLIADADAVFGYPIISSNNYGIQQKFNFGKIIASMVHGEIISKGKFGQIRLLAQINDGTIGHITWKYDTDHNIIFGSDDFDNLAAIYPVMVDGTFYKVISVDGHHIYTFVTPLYAIHDDGSTHITINCGYHAPKETGAIVRAINAKQPFVDLLERNNKIIRYDLSKTETNPCQIRILGAFGI